MDGVRCDTPTIDAALPHASPREGHEGAGDRSVSTVTFGDLTVDIQRGVVFLGEDRVHLTGTEFLLLRTLVLHSSGVIRREALLSTVRSHTQHLSSRSLDGHMSRLRSKLGQYGPWIRTFKGVGYRFFPTTPLS